MKFAKELEQDLVPEWHAKYFDYKTGKKYIKAVVRAANRVTPTPQVQRTPSNANQAGTISSYAAVTTSPSTFRTLGSPNDGPGAPLRASPAAPGVDSRRESQETSGDPSAQVETTTSPRDIPPAARPATPSALPAGYNSFVPTPPSRKPIPFELPEPAIRQDSFQHGLEHSSTKPHPHTLPRRSASASVVPNAYEVGPVAHPPRSALAFLRERMPSHNVQASVRRMLPSVGTPSTPSAFRRADLDMTAIDQVKSRQKDFFAFLDKELNKVETFYKSKEDEAGIRLSILRDQLHEMRNRRIDEVAAAQATKAMKPARRDDEMPGPERSSPQANGHQNPDSEASRPAERDHVDGWLNPLEKALENAKSKAFKPRPGSNSRALQNMMESPELSAKPQPERDRIINQINQSRDYVRRPYYSDEVPYRTAKRKLKLALREFYRSMELLKSYALLNRTAFRKINKKYDKAVGAYPPLRYMSEKVNGAWFVRSGVLDGHLYAVEDLYARYFERGNHKVATGKLRNSVEKASDQSASSFQNGILIGTGAVLAIQGVIYGRNLLSHPDPTVRVQTGYLLQLYAGYFLALYLFCWFCLDCCIWTRNKINYTFVFEFDLRHRLDWRQLAEFPSFLIFLLGLFVWINFSRYGTHEMYIYYPVILIFATLVLFFFPAPILYHRTRGWFLYSNWRLFWAGIYPVEFRDFFLGDMYCSLTYCMSNIELFFCLYAHGWNNPSQCNSTHSRLLGFFSTLPGIWRGLQCLRRYRDTGNIFPHLVNCGKYTMTILFYVTLSMYRIHETRSNLALFTAFGVINGIYSSIWDILMDWSLLQPQSSKRFLRDVRGYKSARWYYAAMIIDPILRFNWIFYSIYTHDLQHSTIVSFLVAFSEITRRGIWIIFRVENEHCSNVAHFKASRDVPLPYSIPTESEEDLHRLQSISETTTTETPQPISRHRSYTATALEAQESPSSATLRRRPTPVRAFTQMVADAHTQDFEKRRKPEVKDQDKLADRRAIEHEEDDDVGRSSDEDDEADDAQDIYDAEDLVREGSVDPTQG